MVSGLENHSGAGSFAWDVQTVPVLSIAKKHPCHQTGTCPPVLSNPYDHSTLYGKLIQLNVIRARWSPSPTFADAICYHIVTAPLAVSIAKSSKRQLALRPQLQIHHNNSVPQPPLSCHRRSPRARSLKVTSPLSKLPHLRYQNSAQARIVASKSLM